VIFLNYLRIIDKTKFKKMRMIKTASFFLLMFIASSVCGQSILQDYFNGNKDSMVAEATKLINMPDPAFKPYQLKNNNLETKKESDHGHVNSFKSFYFTVRDNKKIFAYQFPHKSNNTIIFIHGVKSTGFEYNKTAKLLQEATKAEVFAIDLRGHGKSAGKDGDVDYINQYADDIIDIVKFLRKQKPKGKIIIAGHSMGGGVTLNYAMNKNKLKIDGILLFAPLIGHNSPAIQQSQPAVTDTLEPGMKIHIGRIIGLKMFNELGNHSKDSLPVLFFNMPEKMPLRKYTYRANMSMAPEDYAEGLKSISVPALVIIGSRDEAFNAEILKKAVTENSKAKVQIIKEATHSSIKYNKQGFEEVKKWFVAL